MQKEKLKCNNYSDDFIFYVKFDSLTDMYYYLSDNKKVKKILNKWTIKKDNHRNQ